MKGKMLFIAMSTVFMTLTYISCSGGSKLSNTAGSDSVVTKSKFKRGMLYERDFINGKLSESRVFIGNQLLTRHPIFKQALKPSQISLRSGNSFFTKDRVDTLDIVNPDIPPGNFGFLVHSASIVARIDHGVYVLKYAPRHNPGKDTVKIYIKVLQPENKRFGTGSFTSDSAFYIVR